MVLYECIFLLNAKAALPTVAQVMKQKASCVFEHGGVIRRLENMGIMPLAYPMYRNRQKHFKGRWVLMLYDSNSKCQQRVTDMLRTDPEVIRWGVYKQNDIFRDKYDETNIHQGTYQGEVPAYERDEIKMNDLDEAINLQRLKRTNRFDWENDAPATSSSRQVEENEEDYYEQEESEPEKEGIESERADDFESRLSPLEQLFNDIQKVK
jgi:ribosomal protein S6